MMRLIDADALKDYIDCGHLRPPTELCFSELDVCNMIDKAPTIGGWIPCSERLPEIYTQVILSGKYNEVIGYRRNNSDWMAMTGDGWETDIEHPEDFIAWMPLPEPYSIEYDGIEEENDGV